MLSKLVVKTKGGELMRYGYARVSTKGQEKNGNSLEAQYHALTESGCEEVVMEQYTGSTTARPEFNKLINRLTAGDTLVVTKMDRFARSVREGTTLIQELQDRDIGVDILNLGRLDASPNGKLMTSVLLAVAQFERDMIYERTQAGKEIARTRAGFREGRPPIPQARKNVAVDLILNGGHTYKEVVKMTGLSESTIIRAIKARSEAKSS